MPDLTALTRFAAAHHGLVTFDASGLSRPAWYRHQHGLLVPVTPGVSRLAGAPETPVQRILAAVLAAGDGAIASHRSAALIWGVEMPVDAAVDIIVPRSHSARTPGVVIHRPADYERIRPVQRGGVPVTNPLDTLLQLGAVAAPELVTTAVEHFLVAGTLRRPAIEAAIARGARPGRAGLGVLRAVLAEWALGDKPPDSVLEPTFARLLRRHGLPAATFHPSVAGYEPDFGYLEERLLIEVDGLEAHGRRQAFERDHVRLAVFGSQGYRVLPFTWLAVVRRSALVAARVAEGLVRTDVA